MCRFPSLTVADGVVFSGRSRFFWSLDTWGPGWYDPIRAFFYSGSFGFSSRRHSLCGDPPTPGQGMAITMDGGPFTDQRRTLALEALTGPSSFAAHRVDARVGGSAGRFRLVGLTLVKPDRTPD